MYVVYVEIRKFTLTEKISREINYLVTSVLNKPKNGLGRDPQDLTQA